MNIVVLHMRGGSAVTYSPPDTEVTLFLATVQQRGFTGSLSINGAGQRIVNLAAVDWIEIKGGADAAPAS